MTDPGAAQHATPPPKWWWVPSAVTWAGHLLTFWWLVGGPIAAGVAGLLLDALDGYAARRLGVSSAFGSLYDWAVDVTVCALVLQHLGAAPLCLVLVPLQVRAHLAGKHVSGRTAVSIVLMLVQLAPLVRGLLHR